MGAAVPLACFRPIVGVSDTFATPEHAWRILLMPSVLLAAAAVLYAVFFPSAHPGHLPPALAGGGALLILAAVVSTAASQDPAASAIIAVLAISAPIILVVALLHADVSPRALALGFLVTSAGFLLRADAVFLRDWGLPTASTLRTAKLSDQPYDFHYYTLGNADHTAGFLLMTLVLAAFWAGQRGGLSRYLRALLWVIAAISLVTMFLTYARFAIVTAIIALGILILVIPVKTWSRIALLSITGGSAAIIAAVNWHYISTLLDTGAGSSGFVRTTSIENGLAALSSKPLTGLGLGQYGPATGIEPAHSAIVQAGAEMGIAGLLAILLITAALVGLAIRLIRRYGWLGLPSAAALGRGQLRSARFPGGLFERRVVQRVQSDLGPERRTARGHRPARQTRCWSRTRGRRDRLGVNGPSGIRCSFAPRTGGRRGSRLATGGNAITRRLGLELERAVAGPGP